MIEEFLKDIFQKIKKSVKEEIEYIYTQVGGEKIYAVALVSDEDAITLFLAVNTLEYLKKKDRKNLEFMREYLSPEKIEAVENGTKSLTKYIPDEWGYSDRKGSGLNEVSSLLFQKEGENAAEYAKHKGEFFEMVTSALEELKAEGVFGNDTEDITFFVSISDGEDMEEIIKKSAGRLNSPETCKEIFDWFAE